MGRETEIGHIWGMIKRMNGIKREFGYLILRDVETTAVRDEEKAEMLLKFITQTILVKREKEEGKVC